MELTFSGHADRESSAELASSLVAMLSPERDIVARLDELESLDATGIQLLFAVKAFAENFGRRFSVIASRGPGRHAFEGPSPLPAL